VAEFRVVVFSSMPPAEPWRLMARLEREVPGARVAGLLYEQRRARTLRERWKLWQKNLPQPGYLSYVARRIAARLLRIAGDAGHALLRLAQASRVRSTSDFPQTVKELTAACASRSWASHLTADIHSAEALAFVRSVSPDLGIVLGTRILQPALYRIPVQGSVNLHKRKVPDYRGGGAIGLWELLDAQNEIGVTIHRVEEQVDTGAILRARSIPVDELDSLDSLALKADVVGEDLLLETVRDFVQGTLRETPQSGPGKTFKGPKPFAMSAYEKRIARMRKQFRAPLGRPAWKLLLRSSLYLWLIPWRNWQARRKRNFPVVILYHHLVSERPHPIGMPTTAFAAHLRYLKRHYRIVSLADALAMLRSGRVEEPTAVLTLDDGYGENFINLRAALRAEPAPVTLFVCPELIEKNRPFPHDVRDLRLDFRPFTPAEVQRLAGDAITIGSHTRTHFDCGSTDAAALEYEITGSRQDLERLLGAPVPFFSFPWGQPQHMSEPARQMAATQYRHFFSAFGGANLPGQGAPQHLKRVAHPPHLWELELALQGVLDFGR